MRYLAFDKASVRSKDVDGRLHVSITNISKATVDPYYGHEIPDAENLGLDPGKVYYLLRDPRELKAAAATFNNLPILSRHVPVSAEEPMSEIVIGSTGTDAAFDDPFLQNSAVIWDGSSINDIETETKRAWSCGYYYRADMTPGVFKGLRFDGVMRDIVGNHVALVEEGRAGPEVIVGDSLTGMVMLKSRIALMVHGALAAAIVPKLAQDAKISFAGALDGVTAKNLPKRKDAVAKAVVALVKGKLAADEGLDVEDVVEIIQAVQGVEPDMAPEDDLMDDDDKPAVDADDDCIAKMLAFLKGKISDEDLAELSQMTNGDAPAAMDDDNDDGVDDDKDTMPRAAMDAALKATRRATLKEMAAIREAERAVRPLIGEVSMSLDSAAKVYKLALDHAEVDVTGVHTSAYKSLVAMLVANEGKAAPVTKTLASDHASAATDFAKRFPNASTLVGS
jgi:hypothetical protein